MLKKSVGNPAGTDALGWDGVGVSGALTTSALDRRQPSAAAARYGLVLAADPDDPDRRVLAVAKGNLARPAPALAFRLEDIPGATVARVVWDGESPWTATQLLQGQTEDDGDGRRSVIAEARAWLRKTLAAGPRPAQELREESAARGIGRSTLYAAQSRGHHHRQGAYSPGPLDLDPQQPRR